MGGGGWNDDLADCVLNNLEFVSGLLGRDRGKESYGSPGYGLREMGGGGGCCIVEG